MHIYIFTDGRAVFRTEHARSTYTKQHQPCLEGQHCNKGSDDTDIPYKFFT